MRIEYVFPQSFNPDDVDIRLQYISVSQLEKMIETVNCVCRNGRIAKDVKCLER